MSSMLVLIIGQHEGRGLNTMIGFNLYSIAHHDRVSTYIAYKFQSTQVFGPGDL